MSSGSDVERRRLDGESGASRWGRVGAGLILSAVLFAVFGLGATILLSGTRLQVAFAALLLLVTGILAIAAGGESSRE